MTTYAQRYSSSDSNTSGAFVFHADASGNDVPIAKVVFGAAGADPTIVTASVGLPITILAGSAAIGKLTSNSGVTIGAVEIAAAQSIAATQSGTWTVGVSGTVAISAASLPLPSGAATAAKQPALGTAGTASSDVLTVQGIASMTALKTDGSGVTQPVSGTLGATQSGTWTVQPGNTANTTAWLVTGTGGTFPATQSGTWTVGLSAAQTLATVTTVSTVTNLSQMGGVAIAMGSGVRTSGTQRVTIATDDSVPVTIASVPSHAVTNAGTFAVQESGTPTVVGSVAHDAADSGNPVKIGAKATTALSGVTLVADADRTNVFAGVDGVQIVRPHCNLEDIVSGNASNTDGTSTQCIAAQSAGIKTYLTTIILTNTSSSNIYVEIKDGTTVKLTIPVPANGGAVVNPPVPLGGTAATAWNFDPSAATSTVFCSMIGFKSKV